MKTADDWFREGVVERSFTDEWSDLDNQQHLDDALAAFEEALAIDPKHLGAARERGLLLSLFGRHEEALDALISVAAQSPPDADLSIAVGESALVLGHADVALASFETARALRPENDDAAWGRAQALMKLGHQELALAAWNEPVLAPDRPFRKWPQYLVRGTRELLRASTLARLGRPDSFAGVIAKEADHLIYVPAFADALREHETARQAFRAHLQSRAAVSQWQLAATAWREAGFPEEALVAAEHWVALAPEPAAFLARARAHVALGQLAQARAACLRAGHLDAAKSLLAELDGRTWKIISRDAGADFVVGEFASKEAAESRLSKLQAATPGLYWLVAPA